MGVTLQMIEIYPVKCFKAVSWLKMFFINRTGLVSYKVGSNAVCNEKETSVRRPEVFLGGKKCLGH